MNNDTTTVAPDGEIIWTDDESSRYMAGNGKRIAPI